ncbi:MAG TPA: hypothetical protein VH854_04625 [Thermoanaerobaculia bacterium]|nr:hypothetical protein [Thermoanaerobaculia bacterium]
MRAAIQILALGVRLALAPAAAGETAQPALPDYSGVWRINRDLSDDPAQAMRDYRGSSSGRSGGWHGRGGGHGRHSGGDDASGQDQGGGERPALAALDTLAISHHEPEFVVADGSGRQRRMTTDGKAIEEERSHGGTTKISANWKEGHLVVVTAPEQGPKWTETYSITADRTQLTVTTKIEGSRGSPVTIHRVYDAMAEKPQAPEAAPQAKPTPEPAPDDSVSANALLR